MSTLRSIPLILRIKLLDLTGRFPPLPGGVLDEQTRLLRRAQQVLGEAPLDQVSPAQARLNFRASFPIAQKPRRAVRAGRFRSVTSQIPGPDCSIPARLY